VPTGLSHEYVRLWPHARVATIANTGHLGLITRPDEFARIVVPFAESAARRADGARRRIG
jgi:pimeloyl-ACP methyl ester carboxylesterase